MIVKLNYATQITPTTVQLNWSRYYVDDSPITTNDFIMYGRKVNTDGSYGETFKMQIPASDIITDSTTDTFTYVFGNKANEVLEQSQPYQWWVVAIEDNHVKGYFTTPGTGTTARSQDVSITEFADRVKIQVNLAGEFYAYQIMMYIGDEVNNPADGFESLRLADINQHGVNGNPSDVTPNNAIFNHFPTNTDGSLVAINLTDNLTSDSITADFMVGKNVVQVFGFARPGSASVNFGQKFEFIR